MQDERTITINIKLSNRGLRRLVVVAAVLALAIPTAAWAGHQFSDVPDSNVFHDDIDWMRDNNVTAGCNPPANTKYCPGDNVTREQMAAFMHRLESEGVFLPADGKAADADKLDGKNSSAFLGVNAKAADADKLDGKNSSAFLGVNAKAADADELDGMDSTAFFPRIVSVSDTTAGAWSVTTSRGLSSSSHTEGTGLYHFTFDTDISDCAWTGTAGTRNNAVFSAGNGRVVHVNSSASGPESVRVEVVDSAFNDIDASFDLVINC